MTTSTALTAQGTTISINTGTITTPVLVPITNVSDITGFNGAATAIDVTSLTSVAKETVMGLQVWGTVTLTTMINLKEASHAALLAAKKSSVLQNFIVTLPGATTLAFTAFVTSFPIGAKVDAAVTGAIVLTISGDVTVVVGP